jgi:hypothetical protein
VTIALQYAGTTLLAFAGFAALSLAMSKHFATVMSRELTTRTQWLLHALGTALLAITLMWCIRLEGIGVGIVGWCGVLTVSGICVASLLTYRPRMLVLIGTTAFATSALVAAMQMLRA